MPINIIDKLTTTLPRCSDCKECIPLGKDAMPGYSYSCKLLCDSPFHVIPDETITQRAVFPDCPKLKGTDGEGSRYRVVDGIGRNTNAKKS